MRPVGRVNGWLRNSRRVHFKLQICINNGQHGQRATRTSPRPRKNSWYTRTMVRMQPPTYQSSASPAPPGLLVSVRSLAEARDVATLPVAVLDLKEPDRGPLGACDPDLWHRCQAQCRFDGAWSAALGESASALELAGEVPPEFAFAKAGPSGLGSPAAIAAMWAEVRQRLPPTVHLVAVAYADFSAADSLPPEQVLAEAARHAIQTLLIDTFTKDGRSSIDHLGTDRLRSLVAQARRRNCDVVLAGGVTSATLPVFVAIGARRIGVRGGVCRGDRRSEIDSAEVARWANRLRELAASSSPTGVPPQTRPVRFATPAPRSDKRTS